VSNPQVQATGIMSLNVSRASGDEMQTKICRPRRGYCPNPVEGLVRADDHSVVSYIDQMLEFVVLEDIGQYEESPQSAPAAGIS
jgi:hypothetical protein